MRKISYQKMADLIIAKRKEQKITQAQLAEMTGIHRAMISRLEAFSSWAYVSFDSTSPGRGPIILISPPDVKIETTFFQRNFFSTIPCNYPQKQHKKRTSDLSEVPILRCFLKILPLSASLPASYQIPPDCTPNGIFPSNDTSFPHPIRTFSISFAALAHY